MKKTKVCKKCSRRKKVSQFGKQKACKDGLRSWCKKCYDEYNRKYYQVHRVKLLDKSIGRYYNNKEKQNGSKQN